MTSSESKVLREQLHTCYKLRFLYVPVKIFSSNFQKVCITVQVIYRKNIKLLVAKV